MKGKLASGRSARLPPTPGTNVRHIDVSPNSGYNSASNPQDNTIEGLGPPDIAVATSQVLDSLSDRERQIIFNVLNRDDEVRHRDATRIMLLRNELHNLRRKGALKTGGSLDHTNIETDQSCSRCRIELGKIINRGASCRSCRMRVCKACREFSDRTMDWVCIVCHKQLEIQAASGEWINEYSRRPPRRDSLTKEYIPASDIIKKSIRRSWTVTSPQQEQHPNLNSVDYPSYASLPSSQNLDDYKSVSPRKHSQYNDQVMDYQNNEYYERSPKPRRVLRQTTLPTNLPNPDHYYPNNVNLMPPISPKQQLSPQYSPYNTDNEDSIDCSNPDLRQIRYPMRRQSTLPSRPNEQHAQKYLPTSPNRSYSRSPEKSDTDQKYPPFVRQSTFPSNSTDQYINRPKILLPNSPNRSAYGKPSDNIGEQLDYPNKRHTMLRQSTLPNPEQHIKLLPTSPPKRQSSPQYVKVSPSEMIRQNTLSNPDGMNSLSIHQHSSKFLPISPRHKQNFLFPQPAQNPRQFLSQQNVPTVTDDPYSSTGSVKCSPREHHAKMIKVRSHSNEEYSANRQPTEGNRRILPEIPRNRSPSRLVRQSHVYDESQRATQNCDQKRTFADAKMNLPEYEDTNVNYVDTMYANNSFLEVDEESYEMPQYRNKYSASDSKVRYDEEEKPKPKTGQTVRSADSFLNDHLPEYVHPDEGVRYNKKERPRRRKSKEIPESDLPTTSIEEEPKRKPEAMRSISEDVPQRIVKPITRRSFSHPEKESQAIKRDDNTKIPNPKPLIDFLDRSKGEKPSKIPSPRRKVVKSLDQPDGQAAFRSRIPTQIKDNKTNDSEKQNEFTKLEEHEQKPIEQTDIEKEQINQTDNQTENQPPNEQSSDTEVKKEIVPEEHKTTLGEAEIQSAVEAAAVVFKKVVLQRRAAKKQQDEGEKYYNRIFPIINPDESDYESQMYSKNFYPDCDDYKLVFISSDSSSKEDDNDDTSSTSSIVQNRASLSLDDCDWDYFEPGAITNSSKSIFKDIRSASPFDSPILKRKITNNSPFESPLFIRKGLNDSPLLLRHHRIRESDTGTDEDIFVHHESSSSVSSDSFTQNLYQRKNISKTKKYLRHSNKSSNCSSGSPGRRECDCGNSTQYVPIPVPVPIPVLITDINNWKSSDLLTTDENNEIRLRAIEQKEAADIFQLWNTTAPGILLQQQLKQNTHLQHQQQQHQQHQQQQQQQQQQHQRPLLTPYHQQTEDQEVNNRKRDSPQNHQQQQHQMQQINTTIQSEQQQQQRQVVYRGNFGGISETCKSTQQNVLNNKLLATNSDGSTSTGQLAEEARHLSENNTKYMPDNSNIKHINNVLENKLKKKINLNSNSNNNNNNEPMLLSYRTIDNNYSPNHDNVKCLQNDSNNQPQHIHLSQPVLLPKVEEVREVIQSYSSYNNSRRNANDCYNDDNGDSNDIKAVDISGSEVNAVIDNNLLINKNLLSATGSIANTSAIESNETESSYDHSYSVVDSGDNMISINKMEPLPSAQSFGYLQSEDGFSSSLSGDSSSDRDESSTVQSSKSTSKSIRRSYNVSQNIDDNDADHQSPIGSESSDVYISDDETDRLTSSSTSAAEDVSSSAGEATDSDDTGTVADRRPKARNFYKVFVVNKNNSSSNTDSQSSHDDLTEDSSDNDTNTEEDCGITLNYVKFLNEPINDNKIGSNELSVDSDPGNAIILKKADTLSENDDNLDNKPNVTNEENIGNYDHNNIEHEVVHLSEELLNNEPYCKLHETDRESLSLNIKEVMFETLQCSTVKNENKENQLTYKAMYDLNKCSDLHEQPSNSNDLNGNCTMQEGSVRNSDGAKSNIGGDNSIIPKITSEAEQKQAKNETYDMLIKSDRSDDRVGNNKLAIDMILPNVGGTVEPIKDQLELHDQINIMENDNNKTLNNYNINVNENIYENYENDNTIDNTLKDKNKIDETVSLVLNEMDHSHSIGFTSKSNAVCNNQLNKNSNLAKVISIVAHDQTSLLPNDEGGTSSSISSPPILPLQSIQKNALTLLLNENEKTETQMADVNEEQNSINIGEQQQQQPPYQQEEQQQRQQHQQQKQQPHHERNKNFVNECTSIQSTDHNNIMCNKFTNSGIIYNDYQNNIVSGETICESVSIASTTDVVPTEDLSSVEICSLSHTYDSCASTSYKSLVMITQNRHDHEHQMAQVSVVPTDTTQIISDQDSIVVQHTNRSINSAATTTPTTATTTITSFDQNSFANYYTSSLEDSDAQSVRTNKLTKRPQQIFTDSNSAIGNNSDLNIKKNDRDIMENSRVDDFDDYYIHNMKSKSESVLVSNDDVTVVTGSDTLSAVVCLEDGLADDDSWVEEISHDEEEFATSTATESDLESSEEAMLCQTIDREEELRGFNRSAIDFTLHTIVEESCEESEVEQNDNKKHRNLSVSELEKYFFFGLGDGKVLTKSETRDDSLSESSSLCSEGIDSLGGAEELAQDINNSPADLASSRLEKYFLSGFMGFSVEHNESDGSGSVGSDSEGRPSPEQRRKRLVRARGTPRSHNSSLDNLLAANNEYHESPASDNANDSINSSETDTCDDTVINLEKFDTQNDTLKRKKANKKQRSDNEENRKVYDLPSSSNLEIYASEEEDCKTPQPAFLLPPTNLAQSKKQHSRDSGFIGSNDDLLKNEDTIKSPELKIELEEIIEDLQETKETEMIDIQNSAITSSNAALSRKDSFNNWSSDEETNLMMSKMRQFFKTLIAASANTQNITTMCSKSSTPIASETSTPKNGTPVPRPRHKNKPPQLVYFESELTRLMKTVPGINDDQVREIVEYLSSEDTWSDSYDSSDYTSSDLEGAAIASRKAELQEQISASCQEIIDKFDPSVNDEEGDRGDGGLFDEGQQGLNRETAVVYQKLLASFSKITTNTPDEEHSETATTPPLFAKVMSHIGTRLVALMHEVSSGESHASTSPKTASRYHRKLQQKMSSTTTEDDDSTSDSNLEKNEEIGLMHLPRSKSHDLLLSSTRPLHHLSSSGVSDTGAEEKETSDCERFSWRGSFESALLANGDSRSKLTLLDRDNSSSVTALAAKRRSAGDLLFNHKSLSREQLDRVRSCGSIGGGDQDIDSSKIWNSANPQRTNKRRSSVPDSTCDSDDNSSDDDRNLATRSTLPRSLQNASSVSTNSLPRLSLVNLQQSSTMQKSHSVYQFLPNSVKSARYRAPGFNKPNLVPKKAVSSPGLQQSIYSKRDGRRRMLYNEESNASGNSPIIGGRTEVEEPKSPAQKPTTTDPWPLQCDEDIDRLVAMHQNRSSLSSLGLRSDSMASVYSGAGEGRYGAVIVKGQVEFGMQYNYKQGALEIHVVQCKDLAAVDTKRNRSDPYVKLYLLPDKSKTGKRKTKVKKHTLNPYFDETLKFHMSLNNLESRTLWLTVWHSDMFGRNDFLGEVMINLQGKVFDNPHPQWYLLQERSEPFDDIGSSYRGDIIVGLKFIPPDSRHLSQHASRSSSGTTSNVRKFGSVKSSPISRCAGSRGTLHVLVKEAKNLTPIKANGSCDAFCKSYLLPDRNRSSKQKTPVIKRTVNPVWNYTFIYDDVSLSELSDRALELTIWDHDRLASNEFLGGVRFSLGTGKYYGKNVDWMDSTGKELSLWQSMLNRPNFWVEGCVVLRPSLDGCRFNT